MRLLLRIAVLIALLQSAALSASAAWPFGSKKETPTTVKASDPVPMSALSSEGGAIDFGGNVVTNKNGQFTLRPHLRFPDEKSELEFRTFVGARMRASEDLIVLRRLQNEKIQEVARFEEQLLEDFGIEAKANYEYDADKGAVMLLTRVTNDVDVATNKVSLKRTMHRSLADKDQKERFLRLVASKQLSTEQIQCLELLRNEKTMEVQIVQENINRKFSTSNDRDYRYDRATRTLYELVPVPTGTTAAPVPAGNQEANKK